MQTLKCIIKPLKTHLMWKKRVFLLHTYTVTHKQKPKQLAGCKNWTLSWNSCWQCQHEFQIVCLLPGHSPTCYKNQFNLLDSVAGAFLLPRSCFVNFSVIWQEFQTPFVKTCFVMKQTATTNNSTLNVFAPWLPQIAPAGDLDCSQYTLQITAMFHSSSLKKV